VFSGERDRLGHTAVRLAPQVVPRDASRAGETPAIPLTSLDLPPKEAAEYCRAENLKKVELHIVRPQKPTLIMPVWVQKTKPN